MCLGGGSSPPPPDKALEAEQEQKRDEAISDKKEIKQDALEETVARRKGGTKALVVEWVFTISIFHDLT